MILVGMQPRRGEIRDTTKRGWKNLPLFASPNLKLRLERLRAVKRELYALLFLGVPKQMEAVRYAPCPDVTR